VLEVIAGSPRALVVRVRNTGAVAWRTQDVRLRRVDVDSRVVGASYGALANAKPVEPNQVAIFVVQLAAAGSSDGSATTTWRVEGPSGPFGSELEREVRFAIPDRSQRRDRRGHIGVERRGARPQRGRSSVATQRGRRRRRARAPRCCGPARYRRRLDQ
jgi:hypothetical protein